MQEAGTARRPWGAEHLFAGLVAIFGLFVVFALPPGQGADEPSHFPRACHIAEGHLFPEMFPQSEWGGGMLPSSIQKVIAAFFNVGNNPNRQVVTHRFAELWELPLNPDDRLPIIYQTAAHYNFVPYLPSSAAIVVTRTMGLRILPQFYAGRLANLAMCVLAIFWAIRICPVFKPVLGMTVLIPITIQQCSTYSPDASTLSAAFLLLALLLRLALEDGPPVGKGTLAALFALTMWLALCKIPYVVLLLLYGAIPMARMGGGVRYFAIAAGLVVAVASCMPLVNHGRQFVPNRMVGEPLSNIDLQMQSIKRHPLRYTKVLAATVADHSGIWLDQLGHLGWQDTKINRMALYLYLVVLIVVALADQSVLLPPPTRVKAAALAVCILGVAGIVTSCYVAGSTPHSKLVYGPQGRYFLPLAPLALMIFTNRVMQVRTDPRFLLALAGSCGAAVLLVAMTALVRRYYVSTALELKFLPVSLLLASLLVLVVMGWASRQYAGAGATVRVG